VFHQRKKVSDESSQGEGLIVKGNHERGVTPRFYKKGK
jgi:hypothetical protein